MKNLIKNREPMTPAQKKVAAGIACLVLIVVASFAFDLLLGSGTDDAPTDVPAVSQTVGQSKKDDKAEGADESKSEAENQEASQIDSSDISSLAAGQSLDAGDLTLVNNTGKDIGDECGTLVSSLRTFLSSSGVDYDGSRFTVIDFDSSDDTGAATFFVTSDVVGAQYIEATRSSDEVEFQIFTASDEVGFTALMDQALNGASAEDPAPNGEAPASADVAAGGEQNG